MTGAGHKCGPEPRWALGIRIRESLLPFERPSIRIAVFAFNSIPPGRSLDTCLLPWVVCDSMVLGWLARAAGACAPLGLCADGFCTTNCQLAICAFSVHRYLLVLPAPVPLRACVTAGSTSVMRAILRRWCFHQLRFVSSDFLCQCPLGPVSRLS